MLAVLFPYNEPKNMPVFPDYAKNYASTIEKSLASTTLSVKLKSYISGKTCMQNTEPREFIKILFCFINTRHQE